MTAPSRDPREVAARRVPTIRDVATAADVAVGTVSRVLNGGAQVSLAKRQRVLEAIEQLGYRPNGAAAVLRRRTGYTVGLLVEDFADPYYAWVQRAIEDQAMRAGWALLAVSSHGSTARARQQLASLVARGIDGIILAVPEDGTVADLASDVMVGTPMVFFDRPPLAMTGDVVVVDNAIGMRTATEHLISRGHMRIACVADRPVLYTATERVAGYRAALAGGGIPADPGLLLHRDGSDEDLVRDLDAMMARPHPPTAVVTGNSRTTVAVMRWMRGRGLALDQVAFDDLELAEVLDPPLTVVAQRPEQIGAELARLMGERLAGDRGAPRRVTVPTELIVRS